MPRKLPSRVGNIEPRDLIGDEDVLRQTNAGIVVARASRQADPMSQRDPEH